MSVPRKTSREAPLQCSGESLISIWAPAAKAKRRRMTCYCQDAGGDVIFAQGKTQTFSTASLPMAFTGNQAWWFSWVTPLIFTNPELGPVFVPIVRMKRLSFCDSQGPIGSPGGAAPHLCGFVAQGHNHCTDLPPVLSMRCRRPRQPSRIGWRAIRHLLHLTWQVLS